MLALLNASAIKIKDVCLTDRNDKVYQKPLSYPCVASEYPETDCLCLLSSAMVYIVAQDIGGVSAKV